MSDNFRGNGISFLGLLTIVFIVLRLTGFIQWSWVWVLAPLWGGFVITFVIIFVYLTLALVNFLKKE